MLDSIKNTLNYPKELIEKKIREKAIANAKERLMLEQLTPDWYQKRVIDQFKRSDGFISIPKFSLRSETDLLSLLKLLEVEQPEKILDLSKLYSSSTYLTDAKQISFINVDKNGINVEDSFEDTSLGHSESVFNFKANRPFFFIGGDPIIYIMGIVNDPSLP